MREQSKFNILWSGLIFLVLIFILLQLIYMKKNPEISQLYLDTYIPLAWFSMILCFIQLVFIFLPEPGTAHFSPPATTDNYRLIPFTWMKFLMFFIFAGLILFSVTTFKIQVLPIPQPLNTGFAMSPLTETYLVSFIPAFLEDFTFFWILPQVIFNFLWLLFLLFPRIDVRQSKFSFLGTMLLAILISSIGTAFLIPGFAGAHTLVYQYNIQAYLSAFTFGFMQSTLYQITGLFFPIAHLLHNALFSLGFVMALSIGGISTGAFLPLTNFLTLTKIKLINYKFNEK